MTTLESSTARIPGTDAEQLLTEIAEWGPVTTIILHLGSVFEFKGKFPKGDTGHGFFNLSNEGKGFEGHLNLSLVHDIQFQEKPHRGNESYAFVFTNSLNECIFKIFLGRDSEGHLINAQKNRFFELKATYSGEAS